MTALVVILTLVTAGLILDLAARRSDRRTRAWVATMAAQARCDHGHAADHAAMPSELTVIWTCDNCQTVAEVGLKDVAGGEG